MTYKQVLKLAFRINSIAFLLSPWAWALGFLVLRWTGTINGPHDWVFGVGVWLILLPCSGLAWFLNFGEDK